MKSLVAEVAERDCVELASQQITWEQEILFGAFKG